MRFSDSVENRDATGKLAARRIKNTFSEQNFFYEKESVFKTKFKFNVYIDLADTVDKATVKFSSLSGLASAVL